jgi:hypothetical protein
MQNLESILGVHPKILLKISQFPRGVNQIKACPFSLLFFFFRKTSLWPEGRVGSIGGKEFQRNPIPVFPQTGGERQAPRGITCVSKKDSA